MAWDSDDYLFFLSVTCRWIQGLSHGEGCESDAGIDGWAWNYYSWAVGKTRLVIESYCPLRRSMDHGCKVDIAKEGLGMRTVETWEGSESENFDWNCDSE